MKLLHFLGGLAALFSALTGWMSYITVKTVAEATEPETVGKLSELAAIALWWQTVSIFLAIPAAMLLLSSSVGSK